METHPRWSLLVAQILLLLLLFGCYASQAAMNLPDGIENILGFAPTSSFQCERDGYFGDIDNDCRLFHLCQKQVHPGGRVEWRHWTYACGNQTMFNQLTLTCAFVDEAIPCRHASQFQYLNEVIHKPREPFLTDADVTSGISYYSNRIMSDGARARAYEDAQLMAQIGGSSSSPQSSFQHQPNTLVVLDAAPQLDELMPRSSNDQPNSLDETFRELASNSQPASQLLQQPQHFRSKPEAATNGFFVSSPRANVEHSASSNQQSSFSSQQQQQQQPPAAAAQSFDFSIATNHQIGSAQNNLALELGLNHLQNLQQQQQQHFQNQQSLFVQSNSADRQLHHPQAPPPPPPQPQQPQQIEVKVTTRVPPMVINIQPTTGSSLPTTSATTTPARQLAPETAATTTVKPLATTLANSAGAPAPTTMLTPIITVTPVVHSQRPSSNQQTRRRQAASSSRTNQQLTRQQASSAEFSHSPGFQSTRINRSRPTRQDGAIVMRPAMIATTTTTTTSTTSSRSSTPTTRQPPLRVTLVTSQSAGEPVGSSAFWRRPFDAHFVAPRFESLLTRRRV